MTNEIIEKVARENGYVLSSSIYKEICDSPQVDHVLRVGNWYDIWTKDGAHWRVTIGGNA